MERTASKEISLVKSEALNGNKSAAIESGLAALFEEFTGYTANTKQITGTHIKSGTLERVIKHLAKGKESGKAETEPTSLSIIESQDDGSKRETDLTLQRLRAFWRNPDYTLTRKWSTLTDFFIAITAACKRYEQLIAAHRVEKLEKTDQATEQLYGTIEQRIVTPLGESLLPPTINQADKEFVYDHLRTNSGELYWYNDGQLSPIYKDEKSGTISSTCAFWEDWGDTAYTYLKQYQSDVVTQADLIARNTPIESGMPVESFDNTLSRLIPRVVLQNLSLVTRIRKESDRQYPDGYEITIKGGKGMSIEAWKSAFGKSLFSSLKLSYVKPIKQFSNTIGEGLTYFSLDGINVNGDSHTTRPTLPEQWNKFLFGPDGNRSIFACDVEMSLLRVAYFVTQLVTEDSYTRQILFCAGGGNDGKTTFCETLAMLLGKENAISLNPAQLDNDGNRIGLINKSFVYLPDVGQPSTILDNPVVKQLTGRDTMPMRKLYCSPFNYTPEHVCVAITTNKTVYAKGIHQTSRILPLTFQINYTGKQQQNPDVLKANLLSERTEFVQWCFDMVNFYRNRKNAADETLHIFKANGMALITDEAYNNWLNSNTPTVVSDDIQIERKLQLAQELEALNNGPGRFVALSEEDAEESDSEIFDKLFNQHFKLDAQSTCLRSDIQMLLIEHEHDLLVRAAGFKISNLNYCSRYRAFLKYLANMNDVEEIRQFKSGRAFKGLSIIGNAAASVEMLDIF